MGCSPSVESEDGQPRPLPRGPGHVGDRAVVDSPTGPVLAGELVVSAAAGVDATAMQEAADEVGATVVWRGPRTGRYVLRVAGDTGAAIDALIAGGAVTEVERHRIVGGAGIATTPSVTLQWNLPAAGFDTAKGWANGAGVVVAVLDTGVAYEARDEGGVSYAVAPDLAGVSFVAGYDFVADDEHANDDNGHGTHIAATIAGQGALLPIAGGVDIMPIKVLDGGNVGTELALAEGILYAADHGAKVINMSLAMSPRAFPSRFLQEAVATAQESGAVLVASAGNQGADVVTYPAAFRDVIAVGASRLSPDFTPHKESDPFKKAAKHLELAPYSNRGALVDVAAPGGMIEGDLNGDGAPEAILAQSFITDPASFEYVYYAGSSQAAATVSGLAAVLLAGDPGLDLRSLRAHLGDTARHAGPGSEVLTDAGRGYLDGGRALARNLHGGKPRPHYFAAIDVDFLDDGDVRAVVDIGDVDGEPVHKAEVYGSFTGGVFAAVRGETDRDGRVVFTTDGPTDGAPVVGFQVEAVVGKHRVVDRPSGLVHVDSCSLERLAVFATALEDQTLSGMGIATTPGAPVGLREPAAPGVQSSVLLVNYAWAQSTVPLAVAVKSDWLMSTFDDVVYVESDGAGVDGAPVAIDPQTLPGVETSTAPACVDLLVHTDTMIQGIATTPSVTPILPAPDGSCRDAGRCDEIAALLTDVWENGGATDGSSLDPALAAHLEAVVLAYAAAGGTRFAAPATEYGDVLEAAGIGLTPLADAAGQGTGQTPLVD